jgi:hypothetical protein
MSGEWLKVMLEEIDRKKAEEAAARADPPGVVMIESGPCAGENELGNDAQSRDRGRGRARS